MRKLLILILIVLLIVLSSFIAINGFKIGNIEILSYNEIKERNQQLDEKIQQASKLVETDYKNAVNELETDMKKLTEEKKRYEEMTLVSTDGDVQNASQLERYELETLWVKLGTYATSEGVILKMDVKNSANNAEGYYNLEFKANGSYISITDFISDIENDSTLGFKIEEFNMTSADDGQLQATFVCKDIAIKDVSQISSSASEFTDNEQAMDNTLDSNISTGTTNTSLNNNNTNTAQ